MKNKTAVGIARSSLLEIRILLRQEKNEQALEIADAVTNLPVDESNLDQEQDVLARVKAYLDNHEDRAEMKHWQSFMRNIKVVGRHDEGLIRRNVASKDSCPN